MTLDLCMVWCSITDCHPCVVLQDGHLDDELGPSTGTSALPSIDLGGDSLSLSSHGYRMGNILEAMLNEWQMGDQLLDKSKKKKHRSKQSLSKTDYDEFA